MTPIHFPEANTVLRGGPAPKFGTAEDVLDLHTYRDGKQIVSLWAMSWRERLSALVFGRVWVYVSAPVTSPPIGLQVKRTIFGPAPAPTQSTAAE